MVSPAESNATTVLLAYAYLSRSLPFPGRFARSRTTKIAFCYGKETNEVEFFGAPESRAGDYASQVAILNYSDPDDFIIRLSSRIRDEFIVCAKIQKPVTLSAGVDTVRKYLDLEHETEIGSERNGKPDYHPGTLSDGDLLAIPVIKLKVKTEYPQLCYRLFTNKGFEHVQLQGVYQSIEFTMDETGAAVRSTAQIEMFGAPAKPRRYVFDKPFLVTLWKEKADQPYFALWAAGPDVMVPGKKVK